jgi:plasmid stabilization system protein ParE
MDQVYQVVITIEASHGLQSIVEYLESEVSTETAEHVKNGLLEAIESLERMPTQNSIVAEISDEQIVYRRILKWSYRIIYVIHESKIEVRVVDIGYSRRGSDYLKAIKGREKGSSKKY